MHSNVAFPMFLCLALALILASMAQFSEKDQTDMTKNAVDVLKAATEMVDSVRPDDIKKLMSTVTKVLSSGQFLGVLGGILSFASAFLPDRNHEEIMAEFGKLNYKIDKLFEHVSDISQQIEWKVESLGFDETVRTIDEAINRVNYLGNVPENQRDSALSLLEEICIHNKCYNAILALHEGVCGSILFEENNILRSFYDKTGGDRPLVANFGAQIFQLFTSGLLAVTTYYKAYLPDSVSYIETELLPKLQEAERCINKYVDKCTEQNEFRKHIEEDMKKAIDGKGSIYDIADRAFFDMRRKYDFLHMNVVVFDPKLDYAFDSFGSADRTIKVLNYGGPTEAEKKNAFVFLRRRNLPSTNESWKKTFAETAIEIYDQGQLNEATPAKDVHNNVKNFLIESGIEPWGMLTINRFYWPGAFQNLKESKADFNLDWSFNALAYRENRYILVLLD